MGYVDYLVLFLGHSGRLKALYLDICCRPDHSYWYLSGFKMHKDSKMTTSTVLGHASSRSVLQFLAMFHIKL